MVSPYINRFIQPDTLIPSPANPQTWNRYSYVMNSPVNFNDPSGHVSQKSLHFDGDGVLAMAAYGVTFSGSWSSSNMAMAAQAVRDVAKKLSDTLEKFDPAGSFQKVYEGMDFKWDPSCEKCGGGGAYTPTTHQVIFASLPASTIETGGYKTPELAFMEGRNNVVHELGHAFAQKWYYKDNSGYDPTGPYATLPYSLVNNNDGFYPSPDEAKLTWRQHPYPCDTTISNPYCGNEDYADMFLGWTYGKWASNEVGMGREKHMNDSMPNWVLFLNGH